MLREQHAGFEKTPLREILAADFHTLAPGSSNELNNQEIIIANNLSNRRNIKVTQNIAHDNNNIYENLKNLTPLDSNIKMKQKIEPSTLTTSFFVEFILFFNTQKVSLSSFLDVSSFSFGIESFSNNYEQMMKNLAIYTSVDFYSPL